MTKKGIYIQPIYIFLFYYKKQKKSLKLIQNQPKK